VNGLRSWRMSVKSGAAVPGAMIVCVASGLNDAGRAHG
jgi:hypothetical protein